MKYVCYYRVSTRQQGESGLGLDAQKAAVNNFLLQHEAEELPPAFIEIESGRHNDRPELRKAVNRCKETGSTLLIAKLDRLARNVVFIFTLKEELENAMVNFIALDLPEANTLTLGIMAVMAQHEAEIISQRTKAGLEAKRRKDPDWKPGTNNLTDEGRSKAYKTNGLKALCTANKHAYHFIKPLREKGHTFQSIANQLNIEGYCKSKGKPFFAMQVLNIWNRFSAVEQCL
jgi:DNA invertase Pin-like site-specific DNA recombinase